MRVLVGSMSAMAETAGPSGRARLLVEHFRDAGIEVATCMAEDVNYKPIDGVKNYYLEVPMPLGLPKAIASRTFPMAQKLGIIERKNVGSFEDVLHFTGNIDYNYLVKSVQNMQDAIKDFNPDIVYSEFNMSAIIASKLENKPLYSTVSYPTQTEYASSPKYAKGLKKFLKENDLPEVDSSLDLFKWADESFVPSIHELEPFDKDNVTFCGTWKDVEFNEDDYSDDDRNVILVYMGNGTISPNKMLNEVKDAFIDSKYEVYIASLGLEKQDYNNIHVDNRWDFSKLLKNAVLFINHGGQNSVIDGLIYGVPQLICPGRVFERIYNGRSVEKAGSGKVLGIDEFKSDIIKSESEKLINDSIFRENALQIGEKLKSLNGIDSILEIMNQNTL
ncbi:nucleotide disphospho-sugar-binding domain-containing protein [Methanobrevibacter sp.]|uniref:glycosyltransferase n=1 Tax=Methanobrevibacter sp. TaxID=66852 RepID=UPI0025CCECDC|nr:nucleotide disphospho-sugar-binding domain-containing protein [Methanobrevibacter sp.]MBQ2962402.1 hypothetical protein [Methanobrevibacter sp.]